MWLDELRENSYIDIMLINQIVKYNSITDSLSLVFGALADPTRRSILAHLSVEDATVNELAQPYNMSLPAISKHLKILERAGLISQIRDAQYRPRHLEKETLTEIAAWLQNYNSR